jgi:PAS domain S-box-containing protein
VRPTRVAGDVHRQGDNDVIAQVEPIDDMALLASLETADGMFAVDSEQRIVYWSDSAERILGHTSRQVIGKRCYDVLGGRDSRNFRFCRRDCPVLVSAGKGRATADYDVLCSTPSGEEKWLNVSVAVPRDNHWPFKLLHLFRDVTGRRRTEESARKASDAIRQLIDDVRESEEVVPTPTPMPKLSRRELEVLRLLATGLTTGQISEALGIKPITVRNHITRVITRLGVENRLQAVVYASNHRLI